MKKFTIGFSPCPNDTFIFDALVNKKIDSGDMSFEAVLDDVETLNRWALEEKLDITKLSYPAFFQNLDKYILLTSGAALGKGVGPLLISKQPAAMEEVDKATIALPGENTTANFLFSFAFPNAKKKIFLRYDQIEDFVLKASPSAQSLGVIIHENRFTYHQKGLHKIVDLGEFWEEKIKLPIPLGGIAARRSIDRADAVQINRLIRKSLEYAFSKYPLITDYVKKHSREMSQEVMKQHIDLYVNNFSIDLGMEGKRAIETFYNLFCELNSFKTRASSSELFIS